MSDDDTLDTIHSIEELRLMVDGDLGLDPETPEAVIVARNVPEAGRRYLVATPEKYPAPDETIDEWMAEAQERYPLDAFVDLDGGTVVGRPQYDEEYHRYGEVVWDPDEDDLIAEE